MTNAHRGAQAEFEPLVYLSSDGLASDLYAPWQAGEDLIRSERRRVAARTLHEAGVFPRSGTPCLEVGFGSLGWFPELIGWGLREGDLHGLELDKVRLDQAHAALPLADLRVGDARELPWPSNTFGLVIASTLFSSVAEVASRRDIANEITRVLLPGGALLWYDLAVRNPKRAALRPIGRRELNGLFPDLQGTIRRVTLAPPLARLLAPRSWVTATLAGSIPFLRSHLLAVMVKR
jgi:hypothetical protein